MKKKSAYIFTMLVALVFSATVTSLFIFSDELGMSNIVREECLFTESCDVPMANLYKKVDWDTFCYETYRPVTVLERKKYDCEFCRIITLLKSNKPVYAETEEYVMERRMARSSIFPPEGRNQGSGVECFDKRAWKLRGEKQAGFVGILRQSIYILPLEQKKQGGQIEPPPV